MNISKKFLGVLLSLVLVFSAVTVSLVSVSADSNFPAYDPAKPNLVIGTAEYKGTEETVKVPVTIGNNPGLWGANFQVQFDSEGLEYSGIEAKNSSLWANCSANLSGDVLTILLAANDLENDYKNDGDLFYLIFTPKAYNVGSTYSVSFKYIDRLSIVNEEGGDLEITYKNGGVKCVSASSVTDPTNPSNPTSPTSPTSPNPTTPVNPTTKPIVTPTTANNNPTSTIGVTLKVPQLKLVKGKKQFKIKYKKVAGATGFQVRYKIKGKWKVKTYNTSKNVVKTIKKLKKGTYSVQIRSFKKASTGKTYSKWSKTKKVKVK